MKRQGAKIAKGISARERFQAALAFHFSAPRFLALASHAGIRRRIGKKIEGIFDFYNLRFSVSYLRLRAYPKTIGNRG
jgi:hypothetical protein